MIVLNYGSIAAETLISLSALPLNADRITRHGII